MMRLRALRWGVGRVVAGTRAWIANFWIYIAPIFLIVESTTVQMHSFLRRVLPRALALRVLPVLKISSRIRIFNQKYFQFCHFSS